MRKSSSSNQVIPVPGQPRIYTYRWASYFLTPFALPSIIGSIYTFFTRTPGVDIELDDYWAILVVTSLILLAGLFFWFYAHGVDPDKVWTRFGRIYYKEVRFDQFDRLDFQPAFHHTPARYRICYGRTRVRFKPYKSDYSLAILKILEHLPYRDIRIDGRYPTHKSWHRLAEMERERMYKDLTERFAVYYQQHPKELAKLQALVSIPLKATLDQ
ncbi:hypothetical protein [Boudabousia marimammalium]|uniref:Uncharacterized protein n=1 Tax=Boudabousia marimammalium TaxID=156892 RepID=A0A1Q5PSU3_9ACTO|nr:hypothetical protein [Boudabousia marimammalium]OKL50657.1 hypothetical protein BM477_01540 [Boudabousia marimammalium]